jgi:hypothetical protein
VQKLGAAAVLLSVFAIIELRLASTPLVRFALFRSRSVSGANLVMFLVGAAFFSMWYFLSLYLQNVLGYSTLRAGLAFLPMASRSSLVPKPVRGSCRVPGFARCC